MFLGSGPGGLFFTSDFQLTRPQLWSYLLIPPAWSLGVELSFYILAPFLVRRRARAVAAVLLASLALRLIIYFPCGWQKNPWTYRFFPTELALFLAGVLAYRVYRLLRLRPPARPVLAGTGLGFLLLCAAYPALPDWGVRGLLLKQWSLYLLATGAIPLLFLWCRSNRVDRYVGELSYPVYVCHLFVAVVLGWLSPQLAGGPFFSLAVTAVSVLCSVGLLHVVMGPVERVRQRRVERSRTQPPLRPTEVRRAAAA